MQYSSEDFYARAIPRIRRMMAVFAFLLAPIAWVKFGWRPALGFALGCFVAYLNFYWLKRAIEMFSARASGGVSSDSGQGVVFRFLFRYFLMAAAAYAILIVSPGSLKGLLAGLFLPVVAIFCEAVYEVYAALVRGV